MTAEKISIPYLKFKPKATFDSYKKKKIQMLKSDPFVAQTFCRPKLKTHKYTL